MRANSPRSCSGRWQRRYHGVMKFFADDFYRFRHAILREAAYYLQLPSARARLHRPGGVADTPDRI